MHIHSHDCTHMYFHDQSWALTYTHDHTHPHSLTFLHTLMFSHAHGLRTPLSWPYPYTHTYTQACISFKITHWHHKFSWLYTYTVCCVNTHASPHHILFCICTYSRPHTYFCGHLQCTLLLCLRFSGKLCVLWIFHTPAPDSTAFWFLITPWTVVLCYVVAPYFFTDWATRVDWGHICVNQWLWLAEDG